MHCPDCGTSIPEDSVFCIECGRRIDPKIEALQDMSIPPPQRHASIPPVPGDMLPGRYHDKEFRKYAAASYTPVGTILEETGNLDYSDTDTVRKVFSRLFEETETHSRILRPIEVSPALQTYKDNCIQSLENYHLAAEYMLKYLNEIETYGTSERAQELWDKENFFFLQGIEYSDREFSTSETGEPYQFTEFMDTLFEMIDTSHVYDAMQTIVAADREDLVSLGQAADLLASETEKYRAQIGAYKVPPVSLKSQELILKAIENYHLAAEHTKRYIHEWNRGERERAAEHYELAKKYIDLGKELDSASYESLSG